MTLKPGPRQPLPAGGGRARTRPIRLALRGVIAALWLGSLACGAARAQSATFSDSVRLTPPPGWVAQAPDANQIVLLGPDGLSLIIICVQQASLTAFFEKLLQPIGLAEADLIPQGRPAKGDEAVSNTFIVSGLGPLSRAFVAARSAPSGRLMIAYGFTQPGKEVELGRTILALLNSVRLPALPAPAPAPQAKASGAMAPQPSGQWRRDLAPVQKKPWRN